MHPIIIMEAKFIQQKDKIEEIQYFHKTVRAILVSKEEMIEGPLPSDFSILINSIINRVNNNKIKILSSSSQRKEMIMANQLNNKEVNFPNNNDEYNNY